MKAQVLFLASPRAVGAQGDAGSTATGAGDAAMDGAGDVEVPESPEAAALRTAAGHVRDLVSGTLDVGVEPATLFDISLDDEETVRVETERLQAIVEHASGGGRSPAPVHTAAVAARAR